MHFRFSKHHLLLGGLWYGSDKPTMKTFLTPLIKSLNQLYDIGVDVSTPNGVRSCKAAIVMSTVDLPAKAIMLNMKQFNGKHGCSHCEYEGVPRLGMAMIRDWPYREDAMLARNHHTLLEFAKQAVGQKSVVSTII